MKYIKYLKLLVAKIFKKSNNFNMFSTLKMILKSLWKKIVYNRIQSLDVVKTEKHCSKRIRFIGTRTSAGDVTH